MKSGVVDSDDCNNAQRHHHALHVALGFSFRFSSSGRVPEEQQTDREETHEHMSTLVLMCSFSLDTLSYDRSIVEEENIP